MSIVSTALSLPNTTLPSAVKSMPTFKLLAMPTPPSITTEPVVVLVDSVVFSTSNPGRIPNVISSSSVRVLILIKSNEPSVLILYACKLSSGIFKLTSPVNTISPLTVKLPCTSKSGLTVNVPSAAPIIIEVASPNALIVVALVFNKLNAPDVSVLITSPLTSKSPLSVISPSTVPPVSLFRYLFSTYVLTAFCVGAVLKSCVPILEIKFALSLTSLSSTPTGIPSLINGPTLVRPLRSISLALSVMLPVSALTPKKLPTLKLPIWSTVPPANTLPLLVSIISCSGIAVPPKNGSALYVTPAPTYSNACPEVLIVETLYKYACCVVSTLMIPGNTLIDALPPYVAFRSLIAVSTIVSVAPTITFLSVLYILLPSS